MEDLRFEDIRFIFSKDFPSNAAIKRLRDKINVSVPANIEVSEIVTYLERLHKVKTTLLN